MSLQEEYAEFSRGYWADPDPKQCGCRGSGWALSDLDTWHKCRFHCTPTTPHPEYDDTDAAIDANPHQCLVDEPNKEKPVDDVTQQDMDAAEFKPAPPTPPEPLKPDDIPF